MRDIQDRIEREGKPFHFTVETTAGSTSVETFTIDTSTYQGTAGALANKTLWISRAVVTADASSTVEYLKFDDEYVWDSSTAGEDIDITVTDYFGVDYIPARFTIKIKNGVAASGETVKVELFGLYTTRDM